MNIWKLEYPTQKKWLETIKTMRLVNVHERPVEAKIKTKEKN